jgi:hypothetical protein
VNGSNAPLGQRPGGGGQQQSHDAHRRHQRHRDRQTGQGGDRLLAQLGVHRHRAGHQRRPKIPQVGAGGVHHLAAQDRQTHQTVARQRQQHAYQNPKQQAVQGAQEHRQAAPEDLEGHRLQGQDPGGHDHGADHHAGAVGQQAQGGSNCAHHEHLAEAGHLLEHKAQGFEPAVGGSRTVALRAVRCDWPQQILPLAGRSVPGSCTARELPALL